MKYKVEWIETNKYGDKTASLTDEAGGKLLSVKLGKEFKGQDIMSGHTIEGTEWKSPKNGSIYIFPLKEENPTAYQYKPVSGPRSTPQSDISTQVKQAQERTAKGIEKTMDRKEESIRLSSAQRDAVLIVTKIINESWGDDATIKEKIIKWRNWFLLSKDFNDIPPFE